MSGNRRYGPRGRGAVALTVCLSLVLAACNPHFGSTSGPVQHQAVTSASGESYVYSSDGNTVRATAPETNTETSLREFFWNEKSPFYPDQQSCMTWETPSGSQGGDIIQPGLAMRIAPSGADKKGVKGITVHENIWSAAVWLFAVDVWDSTDTVAPYRGVQTFDLSSIVGKFWIDNQTIYSTLQPGPWHVCARTQGLQFSFKVWTGTNPEPAWTDPDHVFSTMLPDGWDYAGYSGGYVGHVQAGQTAVFSDQVSGPLCLAPDMINSPHCQDLSAPHDSTSTTTSTTTSTLPDPEPTTTLSSDLGAHSH